MTGNPNDPGRLMQRSLPEALVRSLRHEIGDLLQKVYASVAILKERLPADRSMEHGVLARLGSRAETCRRVLDTAHDFVCPITLEYQPVDLAQVTAAAVGWAKERHPKVQWTVEAPEPAVISADAKRIRQLIELLLANAAEAGGTHVTVCAALAPGGREAEWRISDDGPGTAPEFRHFLFTPFFTTRPGHSGLGLALARKLVELHGGQISADDLPAGGFQVEIAFPIEPPDKPQ